MSIEVDWRAVQWSKSIRCTFMPRPIWNGQPVRPGIEKLVGKSMLLNVCWQCESDEKYPDEFALESANQATKDLLSTIPISWVASGDVVAEEIVEYEVCI